MKPTILILILFSILSFSGMELAISDSGQGYYVSGTPSETWFITGAGNQITIYGSDFQEIQTFSTGAHNPYYIYAAGRDFDDDNNIEVLYSVYNTTTYTMSIYLRDTVTGDIQLSHVGNQSTSYYGYSYYAYNERFLLVNRMIDNEYDHCYVYRSGIQVDLDEGDTPVRNAFDIYPNPFIPTTSQSDLSVAFSLAQPQTVSIEIFNIRGQRVKEIASRIRLAEGDHQLRWDGRDSSGKPVATGTYIFYVHQGNEKLVKKNLLIR